MVVGYRRRTVLGKVRRLHVPLAGGCCTSTIVSAMSQLVSPDAVPTQHAYHARSNRPVSTPAMVNGRCYTNEGQEMLLKADPTMIGGQRLAKDATSVAGRVCRLLVHRVNEWMAGNLLAIPLYHPAQFVHGRQRAAVDSEPGRNGDARAPRDATPAPLSRMRP